MTMEEHCPHGRPNACGCPECERDDRERIAARRRQLERDERDRKEFLVLCRGLPAHVVAKILQEHVKGVDWRGSTKAEMAKVWIRGGKYDAQLRGRDELRQKLLSCPRETAEAKKARKDAKEVRRRARSLVTYLEEHAPDRLEEAIRVIREKGLPEPVLAAAADILAKREAGYERQMKANARWLEVTRAARAALARKQ